MEESPAAGMTERIDSRVEVLTIGHSTLPIEKFVEMLKAQSVQRLVDVRTIARSRYNPQFNHEELERLVALGGD